MSYVRDITERTMHEIADHFGPKPLTQTDLANYWNASAVAPRKAMKLDVTARLAQTGEKVVTTINGKVETVNIAKTESVVVRNQTGEEYILPYSTFKDQYSGPPVNGTYQEYESIGFRYVMPYDGNATQLEASWGELQTLEPGDMLGCLTSGPNGDIYRIAYDAWKDGYSFIDDGTTDPRLKLTV
jgi:hypothetical protein